MDPSQDNQSIAYMTTHTHTHTHSHSTILIIRYALVFVKQCWHRKLHWLKLFGCTLLYNKERQSCALQCKHGNNWHQSGALRRTINWINARYIAYRQAISEPANEWHYLTIHLQPIRSDRYTIEHIHKAHSSNNPGYWQTVHNKPNMSALSPALARTYSITPTSPTPRLLHWDHNQPQGLHSHAVCRSRKGTVAHARLMHNNQFYHQHSVTAEIWRTASDLQSEWTHSVWVILWFRVLLLSVFSWTSQRYVFLLFGAHG